MFRREGSKGFLLVLPSLILCFFLGFYPFLQIIYFSLFRSTLGDSEPIFQGFGNFSAIINNDMSRESLITTLYFVVCTVGVEIPLGLAFALLLNKDFRGKQVFRFVMIFPMAISPMLAATMWNLTVRPETGPVNYILQLLHLPQPRWMAGTPIEAFATVMLIDIWQWTPFVALVLLAGLQGVPREPCEAAEVDGANRIQTLRYIVVPYIKNILLLVLLLRLADSLRTMDMIFGTTNGGPGTATLVFSLLLYYKVYSQSLLGVGSAMALFMFVILNILGVVAFKVARQKA